MRKTSLLIIIILTAIMTDSLAAREMIRPSKIVHLYPEGQESDKGISENSRHITLGPLMSNGITEEEHCPGYGDTYNVTDPTLELYFPENPDGQMVIVCPGGGYWFVSMENEGLAVADWMLRQGKTVCVLKYRLPNGRWQVPLRDTQNAFRYCRAHAEEWGIKQIGIMGFSAGGHLAATASTLYTDAVTRPDFSILIYPVISYRASTNIMGVWITLFGDDAKKGVFPEDLSLENRVTADTPPTFLAFSSNDTVVPAENSLLYYDALTKNGVSAEMHAYPVGGHGWGFRTMELFGYDHLGEYRRIFFDELLNWMDAVKPEAF